MTPQSSREIYLRLLRHVRPYWRIFVLSLLTMAAAAATEPLFPMLMKPLLDGGFGGAGAGKGAWLPFAIVGIFLTRGLLGLVADYSLSWVGHKVVMDLRNAMFERLVRLPTSYFENQSSGALMSRVAYDVVGVTSAATTVLTVVVRDTLTVVCLLAWMLYLNWQLTLIALGMIPAVGFTVGRLSKRLRQMSHGSQNAMGGILHILEETVSAHKVVKVFGGQRHEISRFHQINAEQRGYNMRSTLAAAILGPVVQVSAAIVLAIIVAMGVQQAQSDQATVGGFVSFITTMLLLIPPLKRLTDVNAPLQKGLAAAESVFLMMDVQVEDSGGGLALERARGDIAFEQVFFQYPGAERPALDGVSLQVRAGETVALVGGSGGGKTTLANLIPRFYDPSGGRILLDGVDLREFSLDGLRSQVALVSQDVVLFNDTVAANIAYGQLAAVPRERIVAAARAAHALEFIEAMPEGFDTVVGTNGVKLSGGQRQRLAIARALLKDAPILILDEATSALDTQSERAVQEALENLMQNRTTLVIAHRLSTIEKADRIVVLNRGRIVEIGTHQELLAKNGAYLRLTQLQQSGEGG
ncbi:MAG TPA: lipid A export permease/ATP-binding protein MsbA [Azospira sp.]|nr:lipid A export permease/ATP-binding protein MsbA [Azospira sp.]